MRNLFVLAARLMSRATTRSTCAIAVGLLAVSGAANAGLIVAAGDTTPAFFLTNKTPNPATAGNRQFFSNVLGSGTSVLVQDGTGASPAGSEINEFYDSLSGVSSTLLAAGATITAADLAGKDLFVAPQPEAFTPGEVAAIDAFVESGGSLFIMGDGVLVSLSDGINELLAHIGSSLSLGSTDFDDGDQTASGSEIIAHALTSGVLSFDYGATVLVSGGSPLFLTNGLQPFVAVEGAAVTVPEPATVLLFSAALVALGIKRVRTKRLSVWP